MGICHEYYQWIGYIDLLIEYYEFIHTKLSIKNTLLLLLSAFLVLLETLLV